ncbi:hypothetical protein B6V01_004905 [Methanosarcinales archaeon ex4572_44]|nr:MAG: hypothetical protein B6V01_004905 [Methanosarcinales archaeon ex4572_44]
MKVIRVRVASNARRDEVLNDGDEFRVYVRAPAVEGKANGAVVKLLAEFFDVRRSGVRIIRGVHSRDKVIEVDA